MAELLFQGIRAAISDVRRSRILSHNFHRARSQSEQKRVGRGELARYQKLGLRNEANRIDVTCGECDEPLGRHAWITLDRERGALCLACADLDHLVFLPAGNAALTRRATKHPTLSVAAHSASA